MCSSNSTQRGFTLVELVVVVMILGILGAIAAPRLLGTSQQAVDNGLRQTLAVIRDAIDHFAAENDGSLPGADGQQLTFKSDLARYLRGQDFPVCPVGGAKNGQVRMANGGGPLTVGMDASSGTHGWVYNYTSGDFCVNCQEISADGTTPYNQF